MIVTVQFSLLDSDSTRQYQIFLQSISLQQDSIDLVYKVSTTPAKRSKKPTKYKQTHQINTMGGGSKDFLCVSLCANGDRERERTYKELSIQSISLFILRSTYKIKGKRIYTDISWQEGRLFIYREIGNKKNKEGKCHSIIYVSYTMLYSPAVTFDWILI